LSETGGNPNEVIPSYQDFYGMKLVEFVAMLFPKKLLEKVCQNSCATKVCLPHRQYGFGEALLPSWGRSFSKDAKGGDSLQHRDAE